MNALGMGLLISAIITVIFFSLNLIGRRNTLAGSLIAGIVTFFVLSGTNFLMLYFARPSLVGMYGGWFWILIDIVIASIAFGIENAANGKFSASTALGIIVLVLWLGHAAVIAIATPTGNGQAQYLASLAKIEEMPIGTYPDTDADHMLLVPKETATYKAKQIVSEKTDDNGRNLSTIYNPRHPALQSINNHLYWIFQLTFTGYRVANQANRIVPGYIVVDAEDPNAKAEVRLGYKMKYTLGAPTANSLERYVYTHGYDNWLVDDLTIEIRDDWKPFYTASLNKPALHFRGSVPEKMIIIDPETGDVEEYALNEIPEWVDRVYSQRVVEDFLNWWGHWSKAQWQWSPFETAAGRTKVADKAHLVYTKSGHPAWQVLMTSWNSDTSVTAVVLFEGRSKTARVYPVSGIAIEQSVLESFRSTNKTIKNLIPVHPSIHKIYGELSWVVAYISQTENTDGSAPFQGLGLMPVNNVEGASVIYADQKDVALMEYRQLLARKTSNAAPEENSSTRVVRGTVTNVASAVIEGNTNYFLTIDTDPAHVFQGRVGDNLELPFVKIGNNVSVTYFDVGNRRVDISSYDDLDLNLDAVVAK